MRLGSTSRIRRRARTLFVPSVWDLGDGRVARTRRKAGAVSGLPRQRMTARAPVRLDREHRQQVSQTFSSIFSGHFRTASGAGRFHCTACGTRSIGQYESASRLFAELADHLRRCDRVPRHAEVNGHVTIDGERTDAAFTNGTTLTIALPERPPTPCG